MIYLIFIIRIININPFTPGNFTEKCILKLVEQFSGHRRATFK